MTAYREIGDDELEPMAQGASILGAGGGGSPYTAYLNLRELYRGGRRVRLMEPAALGDHDLVAVVSTMGAPLVGQERLSDPAFAVKPVRRMQEVLGRPFDAVMAFEIGGGNAFQPFLVAPLMDLPVVDADTMGRAFPEAQMSSFAIGNLKMFPLALADIRDNEVIIARARDWKWTERISRRLCTELGSIAATCKAPRSGREVKDWAIQHTVSQAIRIGRAARDARRSHRDPVAAVLEIERGRSLFRGKVVDVDRRTTEGFLRGSARIEGLDDHRGDELRLDFQNEFVLALLNGSPCVSVPEIISVMDSLTGEAIGTETLRYGQRVTVVVLRAPALLMTSKGLEHVGPRAFGYDLDFCSFFGADR